MGYYNFTMNKSYVYLSVTQSITKLVCVQHSVTTPASLCKHRCYFIYARGRLYIPFI